MLPRRTSRRACKGHEREWNGFCVDKNLEDEWLVRLNDLMAFGLISICEGHCNRRARSSGSPPHIKLRLKETLLPHVSQRWDESKMKIVSGVNRLFQTGDTYVNLELKFKLRLGTSRLVYREELVVRIHRRHARTSKEMDPETRGWFQRSVDRIEKLDSLITHLWNQTDKGTDLPSDTDIETGD